MPSHRTGKENQLNPKTSTKIGSADIGVGSESTVAHNALIPGVSGAHLHRV